MGSCFLSLLEAQSSLLGSAAEIMSPLGSYKEVGQGLIDTKNTSAVKEATLGWLAAAQVSRHCKLPALLFHGIFCPRSFLYFIQIDSWGVGGGDFTSISVQYVLALPFGTVAFINTNLLMSLFVYAMI